MPDCCDAKLLQGLVRQAGKNCLFYVILAECRGLSAVTKNRSSVADVAPAVTYHRLLLVSRFSRFTALRHFLWFQNWDIYSKNGRR